MNALTPEQERETLDYETRRVDARQRFKDRGFGTQQNAAFDTREAPTTVSSVLNGRIRSEKVLAKLESWLEQHPQ